MYLVITKIIEDYGGLDCLIMPTDELKIFGNEVEQNYKVPTIITHKVDVVKIGELLIMQTHEFYRDIMGFKPGKWGIEWKKFFDIEKAIEFSMKIQDEYDRSLAK